MERSICRRRSARARSTSSEVGGVEAAPSRVAIIAARASSIDPSLRTIATKFATLFTHRPAAAADLHGFLALDERLVQAAGGAAREHLRQHVDGARIRMGRRRDA